MANGVGRDCLVGWRIYKFPVRSCRSGMNGAAMFLPGALSMAGLVETLPVLKIGVETELRGRGGGSFGSWVGCLTPFLFLPGPM